MSYEQSPRPNANHDQPQPDFMFTMPGQSVPIDTEMFRRSYEALPNKEGLTEAHIHGQALKLTIPSFPSIERRAQNPLNSPELGINGNIVAVIGLPGNINESGKWTRREIALIDYGPDAAANPVPARHIPELGAKSQKTFSGYRYAFAPYNYSTGFLAAYAPVPSGQRHVVGRKEHRRDIERYTSTMLELSSTAAELGNVSAEHFAVTIEGDQVTIEDTSELGTDVAYFHGGPK